MCVMTGCMRGRLGDAKWRSDRVRPTISPWRFHVCCVVRNSANHWGSRSFTRPGKLALLAVPEAVLLGRHLQEPDARDGAAVGVVPRDRTPEQPRGNAEVVVHGLGRQGLVLLNLLGRDGPEVLVAEERHHVIPEHLLSAAVGGRDCAARRLMTVKLRFQLGRARARSRDGGR